MRIMYNVYCHLIPHKVCPFLDDSGLKGPKSRYNDEMVDAETSLGTVSVRRFVLEHAAIFHEYMEDTWRAGLTISGIKSAIVMKRIEIVRFLSDQEGRRPVPESVRIIVEWPVPRSTKEARGLLDSWCITEYSSFTFQLLRRRFSGCSGRVSSLSGRWIAMWQWTRSRRRLQWL